MAKIGAFSPELAQAIADYVRSELAKQPKPLPHGPNGRIKTRKTIMAKITASEGTDPVKHSWVEQKWNSTSESFEDMPDGKSGSLTLEYAVNGDATETTANDTIVSLTFSEDPEGNGAWAIGTPSLPKGQHQYQGYFMITQNVADWGYLRSHPALDEEE
jgi:hypothetical protein